MEPTDFPQANRRFGPPAGMDESQVQSVPAFAAEAVGGNLDGAAFVVVAWRPSAEDLAALNAGAPVFLSMMGGLAPHYVGVSFEEVAAVNGEF